MTINSQDKLVCSQSCWSLDASSEFLTQNVPVAMDCPKEMSVRWVPPDYTSPDQPIDDAGELQNSYTTVHSHNFCEDKLLLTSGNYSNPFGWVASWVSGNYTSLGSPGHGPVYARRHTMASVYSFNGISGIQNPQVTVAFEEMWNNAWQDILWQVGGAAPTIGGSLSLTGSNLVLNLLSKSMGDPQLYGGAALWEADILANCQREYDQIISTDSGLLARLKHPISPFYNSYASYNESLRTQNQDYSVLPEFRISEFLDFYIDNGENYLIPNPREFAIPGMTGSQQSWIPGNENNATLVKAENIRNSSQDHFYKVFSNSDFMKHYGRLREDHEPFGSPPTTLTLTCKALMKLLPYDGFFPSERTLQISHLMSQSFGSNIAVQLSGTSNNPLSNVDFNGSLHGENMPGISFLRRPFYSAMMAPGLLYNTIKAGIAVDYPIYNNVTHSHVGHDSADIVKNGFSVTQYTETRGVFTGAGSDLWFDAPTWMYALGTGSNGHQGFDYRIPFEALVEPSNYLSDLPIADMEPHPDATYNYGIIPSSSILDLANYAGRYSGHDEPPGWYSLRNRWNGQFDSVLYERAINNFLAEVPEFFLQDEEFGSIESNPATSFGTVTQGAFYAMRVKLRRTMDKPRIWSSLNRGQNGNSIINFDLPQDPIAFNGIFRQEFYGSSSFTASLPGWSVTLPPVIPPSAVCRENFTMYSNPSAFGPPTSGTGSLAQGYQVENLSLPAKIKRQNQMGIGYRVSDSTNGYYCAFTPPYMDGEAWADIVFEAPRTGRPTLEELQAHSMVILLRVDGMPRLDAEKYSLASGDVYPYVLSEAGLLALQDQESREWGGNLRQNAIWNATSQSCDEHGHFGNPGEEYYYPIHPHSAVAVNNNAMQLDASLNLFGFKDNKWVIQPKFETPHANFNEIQSSFGYTNPEGTIRRSLIAGGDVNVLGSSSCELPDANGLSIPVHGSESVPRGMWHQFGKTEGKKGIWLECDDIPMTWLRERGYLFPGDPHNGDTFDPSYERPGAPYYRGHWTDQAFKNDNNTWEAGINGALYGMKEGGESVYNLEGQYPGPLATILGFNKRKRLGRTAQRKQISEGIVAVPFIEHLGRRNFFAIPENVIRIALGDLGASTAASEAVSAASSATEAAMAALEDLVVDGILDTPDQASAASQAAATAAGTIFAQTQSVVPHKTIVDMVDLMKKYIFPPRMDFVKYLGQIRPFAMYIFEFSHELSQCDLSKIWQNVLPEIGEKMVEQEVSISHKLLANQLMGDFKGSTHESMKDQVQWMVFKVKQRANDDYSSKVAAKRPISRLVGTKKTSSASKYEYSYNWPYDYFSLVEFAKIEATVGFGTETDEAQALPGLPRGPGSDLLNTGIQATRALEPLASQTRSTTNSLPAGERQQEAQEKRKEARVADEARGPFGGTKKK